MNFRSEFAILFLSVTFLLSAACQQPFDVTVVTQIIDGDTVVIKDGRYVRYIGVDAPEKGEFYYAEAKQMNEELVAGKKVRLERDVSDSDKYGRLLRYVYIGDTFVNAEMVKQGCAWAKAYPPDVKYQVYLESVEKEARQSKRGVWK
ncbi:MAG: thermonuclease family protein [Chloroflexi bacterium]|nr:thermonuclease family protein [Chloroflexota bacterium]